MIYLIDSCVIMSNLNEATQIIQMEQKIKENTMAVSNIIVDELKQPINAKFQDSKLDTLITSMIKLGKIKLIDINRYPKVKQKLENIRSKHYRWMTDPQYVSKLIQEGKIKPEDRKSFKYKDLGECSLIAIALENINDNIIVTNDKGKIYLRPYDNIFDYYPDIKIMNYKEFNTYFEELTTS